jgi:uncharacterized phosphosugar-binding protein
MSGIDHYLQTIQQHLTTVFTKERHALNQAVDAIVHATIHKHNLFVFGASHAGLLTYEMTYRAGGLATVNPVEASGLNLATRPITKTSENERLPGYGTSIANEMPLQQHDVVLVHSVSGRNTVMIDFVHRVKERGAIVIAITNVTYSSEVTSRHPSGQRLFEIADIVIDNHGVAGDAVVTFPGLPQAVGPTSTVIGAAIVNGIVVGVTEQLLAKGITPPVFFSANLDGGDRHNKTIFDTYKDHIFYM